MSHCAVLEERVHVNGWLVAIVILYAVAAGSFVGCAGHGCDDVGYTCEQTQITLLAPNDAWVAGTYTLTLTVDDSPVQCTISVPASPSSSGVVGSCPIGALDLNAVDSCPPVVCDGAACEGMSCTPIAGQFQMTVTIQGLPTQVGLALSVNGMPLTSETVAPMSTTTEPNGQGCGACTNASAMLSIPAR
jgi:hypothetical protein